MMLVRLLLVGCGGFLGSMARYAASVALNRAGGGRYPWGTLVVNVVGCLLMGGLMALAADHPASPTPALLFLTSGLLGGFTTFSAFGHETVELLRHGAVTGALLNVAANVLLGLGAVILGRSLVAAFQG